MRRLVRPVDGVVWVENGRVLVRHPSPGGELATLVIPAAAALTVTLDGQPVQGDVQVRAGQQLEVCTRDEPPKVSYEWRVATDRLSATLVKRVQVGRVWVLVDAPPARRLHLSLCERPLAPPPAEPRLLLAGMMKAGLQGQLDVCALQRLGQAVHDAEAVVIRGRRPHRPLPPRYRLLPEVRRQGRREGWVLLSAGQRFGYQAPAVQGVMGRDVYGQVVLPPPIARAPALGDGVCEQEGELVAARTGRLVWTDRWIQVLPHLDWPQDLTAQDNPLVFDGCVTIRGSLLPGAQVRATGGVTIEGDVCQAEVWAGGPVRIAGRVSRAQVYAGGGTTAYSGFLQHAEEICQQLMKLAEDCRILGESAATRGEDGRLQGRLAYALLAQRYPQLRASLQTVAALLRQPPLTMVAAMRPLALCLQNWLQDEPAGLSAAAVSELAAAVRASANAVSALHAELPVLRATSVTHSTLWSAGWIRLSGTGSLASDLEAAQAVHVRGAVRGGKVVAGRAVVLGELGSAAGSPTEVRVQQAEGWIVVGLRHPNTVLEVAGRYDRTWTAERNVCFAPARGEANGDA
ncbi:MAG: FapA family protein [Alicyclobacillus sp.]|nr:FapA family protein [Alicyclobacillus sp.]